MVHQPAPRCEACGDPLGPDDGKVCVACELGTLAIRATVRPTVTAESLASIAERLGLAVGIVYDAQADPSESWTVSIGLDVVCAGATPAVALAGALAEVAPRRCPRCGEVVSSDDVLTWQGQETCFDCHCRLTSDSLDEYRQRIAFRRSGKCIAAVTPGHLCGKPATVVDNERVGMVCQEHATGGFDLTLDERERLGRVADEFAGLLYGSGVRVAVLERRTSASAAVVVRTFADERDRDAHLLTASAETSERALAALLVDMSRSFAEYVTPTLANLVREIDERSAV